MIKKSVIEAYEFAEKKHKGQYRKASKLEYVTHPKYVARVVEQLTNDETLIITALLHDTLEDTDTTFEELEESFGKGVANLVDELTNKKEERGSMKKRHYMLQKMSTMSDEALIVKLSDRFHNVLFLEKDQDDLDDLKFVKYYYKNTRFILNNLKSERLDNHKNLNEIHNALIKRIEAVLDFLQIRYGF